MRLTAADAHNDAHSEGALPGCGNQLFPASVTRPVNNKVPLALFHMAVLLELLPLFLTGGWQGNPVSWAKLMNFSPQETFIVY